MNAYVLIEYYLEGCNAAINVRGVTMSQQVAYDWQMVPQNEFITREAKAVPLFE